MAPLASLVESSRFGICLSFRASVIILHVLPELLHVGSFTLYTYTALINLGLAAGLAALYRQAPEGLTARWLDAGLAATLGGFVGARLLYALVHGNYYLAHPGEIFQIWRGGLAWPGAAFGGLIGAALYCSRKRIPLAPLLDALAMPVALLGTLSWGGCLAAGCAYGVEVAPGNLPAWMVMNIPDTYNLTVPRWPTQVVGIVWGVIALGSVWAARRNRWPAGARFAWALSLTALGPMGLGFLRGDPMPLVNNIRLDVIGSALVLVAATLAWAILVSRPAPISDLRPPTSNFQPPTSDL
jgi:phosphatidylglycerol:prolipoprotein diacylglycerol transferase